ncbi:MAG: PPE domain-containing protein, partial [Mycobacterium sp.]
QLLATNGFGKNLAAIAETESQYQEMWVNNASAMYRYEAATAQATTLSLFSPPPSIVDPSGVAAQASTVSTQAAAAAAAPAADSPLAPLLDAITPTDIVNNGWFQLANAYANQFISSGFPINMLSYVAQNSSAQALQSVAPDIGQGLSEGETALGAASASIGASLSNAVKGIGAATEAPTALVGAAVPMGNLSAPPAAAGLMTASPPVQLASAVSPLPDGAAGFPMLPPLMPPPITSAGTGWRKRKDAKYEDLAMGLEVKGTIMPRNPSAG